MKKPSVKCLKILKTCILYLCFFNMGMCVAVSGPCLLDLQNLVNTDTEHIALIYTARSIGYLIGSVFGGVLLDVVKSKQTILTICNFISSVSMLGIPWSNSLGMLTGLMVINFISLGALDTGGNVVCLNLWGSDSGPYYQALHFTFGLGGLVSPLIAAPFLGDYSAEALLEDSDNATTLTNFTSTFQDTNNITSAQTISKIVYPFSVIGIFNLLVAIMFLATCIIAPTEDNDPRIESKQNLQNNFGFIFAIITLNFFLLFVETGTEIGYAQMLTAYVVKGRLKLTTSVGSFMTSAFWAAFTASRLASVFLAIKLSNLTMIVCDLVITSIGALILLFLASYEWALWTSSILLGAGIASFFPAAVGWLDMYINVTNKIAALFSVGAAFGDMVIPFTISYFIETFPDVLIYVVTASCVLSSLIVGILYLILRKRDKKCDKPERTCSIASNVAVSSI